MFSNAPTLNFLQGSAPVYSDTPLITSGDVNSHKGILKPVSYMQARAEEAVTREKQWASTAGTTVGAARFGGIRRVDTNDVEL